MLRYLAATPDVGITYTRAAGAKVSIYTDADHANRTTDRRSVSGYIALCAGGAVAWGCKTQRHLADSTAQAEYQAAYDGLKHAMWTRNLLRSLTLWPADAGPIPMYCDNEAAIAASNVEGTTQRNKHWEIMYHRLRTEQASGLVKLHYVSTTHQLADALTKAVTKAGMEFFRENVGLLRAPQKTRLQRV